MITFKYFKKYSFLIIFSIIFFYSLDLFSQPKLNIQNEIINIKIQINDVIDSLRTLRDHLNKLELKSRENFQKYQFAGKYISEHQSDVLDITSKLIDYITLLLAIIAITLSILGYFFGKRIVEMKSTHLKFSSLLEKTEADIKEKFDKLSKIENQLNQDIKNSYDQFELLKKQFEEDKEVSMKLLFPLVEGQWFYYQGEHEKAISAFKIAHAIKPDHPDIIKRLNKLLTDYNRIDEAIQNLKELEKKKNSNIQVLYRLGEAYRRKNQFDIAKSYLDQCLKIDPGFSQADYQLGIIWLFKNEYELAEFHLKESNKKALARNGESNYWVLTNLAIVQKMLSNHKESSENFIKAEKLLEEHLSKRPESPSNLAYLALVRLCLQSNRRKSSLKLVKDAITLGLLPARIESLKKRLDIIFKNSESEIVKQIKAVLIEALKKYSINKL